MIIGNSSSRPQTPAFPVHPRTPYVNNSTPSVTFATEKSYINSNNINHSTSYLNNDNLETTTTTINSSVNTNGNHGTDRSIFIEEREDIRETGFPPKSLTVQR